MKSRSILLLFGMAVFALSACGIGPSVPTATVSTSSKLLASQSVEPSSVPDARRLDYCRQTHGTVQSRQAEYNTNGGQPLPLANYEDFCRFTSKKDGSRIYINAYSLYTSQPTLAVMAYLAKVPNGSCQGNPASCYCTLLGGSDQFGGVNAAGGGWVYKTSVDPVLEACIFPDMSSIDSWGLLYHANGIIRGTDLTKIVNYKGPPRQN